MCCLYTSGEYLALMWFSGFLQEKNKKQDGPAQKVVEGMQVREERTGHTKHHPKFITQSFCHIILSSEAVIFVTHGHGYLIERRIDHLKKWGI